MVETNSLTKNLHDLKLFTSRNDLLRVTKTCNKIIDSDSTHELTKKCLAISYIKQKKYFDALKILDQFPDCMHIERAYCFYCLGQMDTAWTIFNSIATNDRWSKELKAQLNYHSKNFNSSLSLYNEIQQDEEDFINERQTNINAVIAASAMLSTDPLPASDFILKSHEDIFNKACYHIGKSEYKQAINTLLHARDKFLAYSKTEGLNEFEANEELALYNIQLAFVFSSLHDSASAKLHLNESILNSIKTSNYNLVTIARNNLLCLGKNYGIYEYRRYIKRTEDSLQKSSKIVDDQKIIFYFNKFLTYFNTENINKCVGFFNQINSEFGNHYLVRLMDIYVDTKKTDYRSAIAKIRETVNNDKQHNESPKLSEEQLIELLLIEAELHRLAGLDADAALNVLLEIPRYYMYSNLLFFIAHKKMLLQKIEQAFDILEKSFVLQLKSGQGICLDQYCSKLILLYIKHNCINRGVDYFKSIQTLIEQHGSINRLVAIFIEQIQATYQTKANNGSNVGNADSDFFTIEPISKLERNQSNLNDINQNDEKNDKKQKKRKRRKYNEKFKTIDANPDPERWLPMHERSYYKPSKKKNKQVSFGGGHQGAQIHHQYTAASTDIRTDKSSSIPTKSNKPTKYSNKSKKKRPRR